MPERPNEGRSRFAGKVGLVTAAAGGGIGTTTVRAFAAEGAHVVMVDLNDEAGKAIRDQLIAEGLSAEYHHCDVTRSDDVAGLFEVLSNRHPQLHFAANVVGGTGQLDRHYQDLHEQTAEQWQSTLDFCLMSTLLCMKHEIASMLKTGGGAIVNVSSMAGMRVEFDATPAYAAAKAAVIHLTRYTAVAYAERAIRINVVAPGLTATPNAVAALGEERVKKLIAASHCIPRAATPEDQANAIVWLCSEEAAMVTGHTVPVDGGANAR